MSDGHFLCNLFCDKPEVIVQQGQIGKMDGRNGSFRVRQTSVDKIAEMLLYGRKKNDGSKGKESFKMPDEVVIRIVSAEKFAELDAENEKRLSEVSQEEYEKAMGFSSE